MTDRALAGLLLALGVVQIALAALMLIDPGSFFEQIGPYGERNDHYTRDAGTFTLALGVVLVLAARRPRWRVPVIAFALVLNAFHAVNHLADIGAADPERLGPLNALLLSATVALLAWMLVTAGRLDRRRVAP